MLDIISMNLNLIIGEGIGNIILFIFKKVKQ